MNLAGPGFPQQDRPRPGTLLAHTDVFTASRSGRAGTRRAGDVRQARSQLQSHLRHYLSRRPVRLLAHAHDAHQRHCRLYRVRGMFGEHLALDDGQRPPRAQHPRPRHEALPLGRGQQIDFKLGSQRARPRWHQTECRITCSGVRKRSGYTAVQISVLLAKVIVIWQFDLAVPRLDSYDSSVEGTHERLSGETVKHFLAKVRIAGHRCRHRRSRLRTKSPVHQTHRPTRQKYGGVCD